MPGRDLQLGERIAAAGSKSKPSPNLCGANANHFQISVVPMPSFSKECLGGFEGFQHVTALQIKNLYLPNFLTSGWVPTARSRADPSGEKRKRPVR
jgi:hypothetical protein